MEKDTAEIRDVDFKVKLQQLQEMNINPYPSELHFGSLEEGLHLRGRIKGIEQSPMECVLTLNGTPCQAIIKRDDVGSKFEALSYIEEGDFVEIQGVDKGSNSFEVRDFRLISKCYRKPPSILQLENRDPERRLRYREEEFISSETLRVRFVTQHGVKKYAREFLNQLEFIEVDTPYLCPYPEIAPVRPFVTSVGKYAPSFYLRITNTEYMRRLLVAGFERIYQLGPCFRDEKASGRHALEFSQLTFGVAYENYTFLMNIIEELIAGLAANVIGKDKVFFRGYEILLQPPFERISLKEALVKFAGFDLDQYWEATQLERKLRDLGLIPTSNIPFSGYLAQHMLIDQIVGHLVAPNLIKPTYLYEYPYPLGGPAKEIEENPRYKQRAELFIGGMEVANVSTPQNNPIKLRQWYNETLMQKIEAGLVGNVLDEDYFSAIELGLPLCATGAVGFDRLAMILAEQERIEDVILYPWKPYADVEES